MIHTLIEAQLAVMLGERFLYSFVLTFGEHVCTFLRFLENAKFRKMVKLVLGESTVVGKTS